MTLVYETGAKLFEGMKDSVNFLSELAEHCELQDDEIPELAAKIRTLMWNFDPPQTENVAVGSGDRVEKRRNSRGANSSTLLSVSHEVVEQKLQWELNDARAKLLESEARVAEMGQKYTNLVEEFDKLVKQNKELKTENQSLKDQAKENRDLSIISARPLSENGSVINGAKFANPPPADVKTAEYFIEAFEAMFKISDQLVQVIKRLDNADNLLDFQPRALEEARSLRQLVHQGLDVFRRAKVEPKTLGSNLTAEVAAELKRIYDTMKLVKHNAERPKLSQK